MTERRMEKVPRTLIRKVIAKISQTGVRRLQVASHGTKKDTVPHQGRTFNLA
jgi:hypothetical protein